MKKNVIRAEIVWDLDGDIANDLQSDDEYMREFAETVSETGLTQEYAEQNVELLLENLGLSVDEYQVSIDLDGRSVEIAKKKGDLQENEAESLFKNSELNINESSDDTVYVQLYSYFQLIDFCFVGDDGQEHPIYLI